MSECIFCMIADGTVPADKIFESESLLAFSDLNPAAPFHALIIPKKHIATLNDAVGDDTGLLGGMIVKAREIAGEKGFSEDGYRLVMNCMEGAGQSVFHVHLHLLGGRPFSWPPG